MRKLEPGLARREWTANSGRRMVERGIRMYFDAELQSLAAGVVRKRVLEQEMEALQGRTAAIRNKARELEAAYQAELADVKELEKGGFHTLMLRLFGDMETKKQIEQEEAAEAQAKYLVYAGQLEAAEKEMARCEAEIASLEDCEERYREELKRKAEDICRLDGEKGRRMLELEGETRRLAEFVRELEEAIETGKALRRELGVVLGHLDGADEFATVDMFTRGGLLGLAVSIGKSTALHETRKSMNRIREKMQAFQKEASDVKTVANELVDISAMMSVLDYFFDGLLFDWIVKDKIETALARAQVTRDDVDEAIAEMKRTKEQAEKEIQEAWSTLEKMAAGA